MRGIINYRDTLIKYMYANQKRLDYQSVQYSILKHTLPFTVINIALSWLVRVNFPEKWTS